MVVGAVQGASCFGPAYEFAFILEKALRDARVRDRVPMTFVTSEPYIGHLGLDGVGDTKGLLESAMREHHIKWITNAASTGRAGQDVCQEIAEDGSVKADHELPFAYSMMIPAFRGVEAVRGIEGLTNPRGFILADKHQRNPAFPDIFSVGVCVAIPPLGKTPVPVGVPKTGFMIEFMVTATAENIASLINGQRAHRHSPPGTRSASPISATAASRSSPSRRSRPATSTGPPKASGSTSPRWRSKSTSSTRCARANPSPSTSRWRCGRSASTSSRPSRKANELGPHRLLLRCPLHLGLCRRGAGRRSPRRLRRRGAPRPSPQSRSSAIPSPSSGEGWRDRGGFEGYAGHVRSIAGRFPHVVLHPDAWSVVRPRSSLSAHLYLSAVAEWEAAETISGHLSETLAWALRLAFFAQARDIGLRTVQTEIAKSIGIDTAAVDRLLESGAAHARLASDHAAADKAKLEGSPTFVLNDGRQKLYGNVGFRVIEANIRELLREPNPDQASWC